MSRPIYTKLISIKEEIDFRLYLITHIQALQSMPATNSPHQLGNLKRFQHLHPEFTPILYDLALLNSFTPETVSYLRAQHHQDQTINPMLDATFFLRSGFIRQIGYNQYILEENSRASLLQQHWSHLTSHEILSEGENLTQRVSLATITYTALDRLQPILFSVLSESKPSIILIDMSPSMNPFYKDIQALTAQLTATHQIYYFNNVPLTTRYLYMDQYLADPIDSPLDQKFEQYPGPVIIISDAGAGHGMRRNERIRETIAQLSTIEHAGKNMIWINPYNEEERRGSSAQFIGHVAPMQP